MKGLLAKIFRGWARILEKEPESILPTEVLEESAKESKTEAQASPSIPAKIKETKTKKKTVDKSRNKIIREPTEFVKDPRDIRDIMELMEVPFLALSKNRTSPIIYESPNGKSKVKISCHREHYIASIYDWDIILCISSKIQELFNSKEDIPPRTFIIPRHELLREIHRHDGKKQEKDIKSSLSRLNTTLIKTTIFNEDGRYEAGFGFLDSWGYTDRKDVKEFRITLSQWLYELTCRKGSLLKVHPEYFKITSGLKRFLYRTARKHVGNQNESWSFLVETLHKKSGSEQVFRCFKRDLKKAIQDNDIPGYFLEWVEEDKKTLVRFMSLKKIAKESLTATTTSTDS